MPGLARLQAACFCRGLTLSEEHSQIRTVVREPRQSASSVARFLQMVRPEAVEVVRHSHCEVSQQYLQERHALLPSSLDVLAQLLC